MKGSHSVLGEVPKELVVTKEVVKEVEVPGETVVVEREVVVEKEVPVFAKFGEAPMLATLVRAGKLPPVDERLPDEPQVIPVLEEIGQYGGTIRHGVLGPGFYWEIDALGYVGLLRFNDSGQIVPAVARGVEVSEDGRELTFTLRKGMKWSDGEPFTADDVMFWYNDIILNEELTPSPPGWLMSGGELGLVEKVDDVTVRFRFKEPNFAFVETVTQINYSGSVNNTPFVPAHYLKQFMPKYAGQVAVDKLAEDEGFETRAQLFGNRTNTNLNPDLPTTRAWVPQNPLPDPVMVLERNPYFYAVDPAGNQLPYVDRFTYEQTEGVDNYVLMSISGNQDFNMYWWGSDYTVLKENEEKGDYVVKDWRRSIVDSIYWNTNYQGPEGELLRNADFRRAMSLAINNEEINEIVFVGLGVVTNVSAAPNSVFHVGDEYAKKYKDYDPERANQLLDSIGLDKRDADGWRLMPDGSPLLFVLTTGPGKFVDQAELMVGDWKDVGVNSRQEETTGELRIERAQANELMAFIHNSTPIDVLVTSPERTVPMSFSGIGYAIQSGLWYSTDGAEGIEPEPGVQ